MIFNNFLVYYKCIKKLSGNTLPDDDTFIYLETSDEYEVDDPKSSEKEKFVKFKIVKTYKILGYSYYTKSGDDSKFIKVQQK